METHADQLFLQESQPPGKEHVLYTLTLPVLMNTYNNNPTFKSLHGLVIQYSHIISENVLTCIGGKLNVNIFC